MSTWLDEKAGLHTSMSCIKYKIIHMSHYRGNKYVDLYTNQFVSLYLKKTLEMTLIRPTFKIHKRKNVINYEGN